MLVRDVYSYINEIAPFNTQDAFDNSGLLTGSMDKEVEKIAVCLDITNEIVDECVKTGVDLIVAHHPVIFKKLSCIEENTPVCGLVRNNIAAICVHTPIDMAKGGISDIMFELMGFGSPDGAEVLHVIHRDKNLGYGKIAELEFGISAQYLAETAKEAFNCTSVKYVDGGKTINRVAVCSGAGSDEVYTAMEKGVDAIITGDVKWHAFVDAKNAGLTVVDAGHYHTETIVCTYLLDLLNNKFPDAEIFIPINNEDVCEYI
ncbi:MAG: Nif3-like dinuclear metal center hexameric protein [Ruminiclostridium sp.]|nr:Nif3-like dinuclear metal center hexameric protein [Ruminiclostridium sp.]